MSSASPFKQRIRLAWILLPPLWLVAVWRNDQFRPVQKLLSSLGILAYGVLYSAVVAGVLLLAGWLHIEWRGGFPPVLTFSKTLPDYAVLEAHRSGSGAVDPAITDAGPPPYWTDFRGPDRDGHYQEMPIRTDWPKEGLPLVWRQPVGGGYASFVIAEGLAFTIEQRRGNEAVTAYDTETGREVWAHDYSARFEEWMGGEGPRATPTWHDGRLYSLGANGDLICLKAATGNVLWSKNILRENGAENLPYGMAASPLIVDEKVIVLPGGPDGASIVACDRLSGEEIWAARQRTPLEFGHFQKVLSPALDPALSPIQVFPANPRTKRAARSTSARLRWAASTDISPVLYGFEREQNSGIEMSPEKIGDAAGDQRGHPPPQRTEQPRDDQDGNAAENEINRKEQVDVENISRHAGQREKGNEPERI